MSPHPQEAFIDDEVFSYGDIQGLDQLATSSGPAGGRAMVLYGETVRNLDILPAQDARHSLYGTVCKAGTPFGRRLLKQWLCNPLLDKGDIVARQGRTDPVRKIVIRRVKPCNVTVSA